MTGVTAKKSVPLLSFKNMNSPWKNAFHPNKPIGSLLLDRICVAIEDCGFSFAQDSLGRITSVTDFASRELLRDFFAPTDDPAQFLPASIVRLLDSRFNDEEEGSKIEQFSFDLV